METAKVYCVGIKTTSILQGKPMEVVGVVFGDGGRGKHLYYNLLADNGKIFRIPVDALDEDNPSYVLITMKDIVAGNIPEVKK